MNLLYESLRTQWSAAKGNPLVFVLLICSATEVLFTGSRNHILIKAVSYLVAMWLCSLLADMWVLRRRTGPEDFPVKKPLQETIYAVLCTLLGILFLVFRYMLLDWNNTGGLIKLAVLPLILFVFPIVLGLIMLLYKYKLKDLGFRASVSILLALPVISITAIAAYLAARGNFTFQAVYRETGVVAGLLFEGFIVAALPEEFTRMILQTRLGALFKNKGFGWFLASFIWACLHIPNFYSQNHDLSGALVGALRILPLGLMWGYMTFRTKSIFPAIIAHGFNMWGLQNF